MIPISDDNPGQHTPFVTWTVVAACVAIYLWQLTLGEAENAVIARYAFVPVRVLAGDLGGGGYITLVTYMFLHGGLLHLGGNLLYLMIFGNNVEDAMGHTRYALFYLVCGAAAAAVMAFVEPNSDIPMVGASGAISGVLAAYVLIFPRTRVTVIIPLGILLYPMKVSAFFVIGLWFVFQLLAAAFTDSAEPGVAWLAHLGGFSLGLLLTPALSRFPLFGRRRPGPWD